MDDHIIFVRTPMGTQHARDASKEMPRAMRTLLLAIDGRTRVASYRAILSHVGDVGMLLEGLENSGYIARTSGPATRMAATTTAAPTIAPRQAIAPRNDRVREELIGLAALTSFQPTFQPPPTPDTSTPRNYDILAKIQEAQSHFTRSPQSQLSSRTMNPTRELSLNRAKSLMTDFLMQHLPDVAMEVGLSIDRIANFDALQASLADYTQLVARTGRVGAEHIREIRSLIATY